MSSEEELDRNPFFVALRDDHALFDQASRNRLIICIPQARSLVQLKIDQNLLKTHILQASPYFQEEFVTLTGKCVTIKGPTLSTRAGFTESRTVKVLFEETFYNAESKSFRVICLNAPLEGSFPKHCTDDTPAGGHSLHRSLAEQQNWLRQAVPRLLLPPSGASAVAVKAKTEFVESVVDSLLRQVAQFNASYVMVKAFYSHAADKLRGLIEKSLIAIVDQADPASVLGSNENQHGELWLALEAACLGATHDKVFSNLVEFTRDKETALTSLCCRLVSRPSPAGGAVSSPFSASSATSSLTSNIEAALQGNRRASVATPSSASAAPSVWMLFADGAASRPSNVALPSTNSPTNMTPPGSNHGAPHHLLPFMGVGPRLGKSSSNGGFTLESLGLRAPLCGLDVSKAVDRLLTLSAPGRNTPVARLLVLKEVSEAIRDAVDAEVAKLRAPTAAGGAAPAANLGDLALTADDLLPLWVYTIVQAASRCTDSADGVSALQVHANMDYMCTFHTPPPTAPHLTSELQFHLANFQAALAYIENSLVHTPAAMSSPTANNDWPTPSTGSRGSSTPPSFVSAAAGGALGMMGPAAAMAFGYNAAQSAPVSVPVAPAPILSAPSFGGKQRKSISMDHLFSNGNASSAASTAARPMPSIQEAPKPVQQPQAAVPYASSTRVSVDTSFAPPAAKQLSRSDVEEGDFLGRLRRQEDVVHGNINRWKA